MYHELNVVFNKCYVIHSDVIRMRGAWKASKKKEHSPLAVITQTTTKTIKCMF